MKGEGFLLNLFQKKQYVDNRSFIALRLQNQSYPEYIWYSLIRLWKREPFQTHDNEPCAIHRWTGVYNATSFGKNNVEDQKQAGTLLQVKKYMQTEQKKENPLQRKDSLVCCRDESGLISAFFT